MKKLLLTALVAGMLLASCTPRNRVVENPLIGAANTMTLDIPKIELSDTATVLHVDAYFRPRNWIRIDAGTYLAADGQKYMLQGSEGIQPDSLFWMPDSGEASFVLKFGPLPRGTKSFDFIESDCDDCFKLYGIDLTGKTEYPRYPEGLPRELQKAPKDGPVPDPVLAVGKTTLNIRLLGYREGMNREIAVYVNSLLNGQKENIAAIDPENGTATVTFEQYGTATAFVVYGSIFGQCWIAPGETIDVYMDLGAGGRAIVQRRNKEREMPAVRKIYTTGMYADLNAQAGMNTGNVYSLNCLDGNFADYRMSADEYTQMVESKYRALADSIAGSGMSGMMKEMSMLALQQEALGAMTNGGYLLEHNYRSKNNQWDRGVTLDYKFAELKPEHYAAISELFDVGNPKLVMAESLFDYTGAVLSENVDWAAIANVKEGVLADLPKIGRLPSKAENNELTQEDLDLLHSLKEPFYAEACEAMQARVREKLEAVKDIRIETTPDVAVDKLFDAIIAPCKGKVVLVDFWNTWCGPCRNALKANEPLKSGELKSDDLVWIYIANETSPLATYKTSIAKIQGRHYRLNPEQWRYICEKFEIDGIPSYVLVNRDGSYKLRNDFRNHETMKTTLKGLLE
ncbi:thioredoxin domain-containing protein [uncultured Alistipes sp.]|jgi:thiol-disulfide isomerase/thioredoxin|uniref:TlpA family protein disulfide reductase n=1 Tax=uncultured Alistipes sp. TaxID=538949 RepID=UPI0025D7E5B6|nr:thioredoxin domain-containing protein [uncultured Alistipes sp.]